MKTSDLRHRINIIGLVEFENELGEIEKKKDIISSLWASIVSQTASLQKQQTDTILADVTHKIVVRYNSAKEITNDMSIEFKGHVFAIKYILNPYFSNEFLEIFCSEVIE